VREALFGILSSAEALQGARVLDLYAGTGALGLEALSRGAAEATLIESSRAALEALRANVTTLGVAGRCRVLEAEVERSTRRIVSAGPFDIVLADPPWAYVDSGGARRALLDLMAAGILAPGAWVVVEHSSRTASPDLDPLVRIQARAYGDTTLTFYKTAILGEPSPDERAEPPSD
jgi:16S rRNA (guanine966-N2)-methyltransferase